MPETEPLQLWAGPECTISRIGDRWRDQAAETGHRNRLSDIDLIADMGIRTVRYPILWESIAPLNPDLCDFAWTDERLARFQSLGIEVIGGLLHHGSGPRYTDLLDPEFPEKFADFAGRVARRYPHIRRWTPINEPLTTARFSALYGHWYPHCRDYPAFLRAVVNQCEAIRRAMNAIRRVIPDAWLLQTEDVGRTFATPPLEAQAAHENERRWLSFDLLSGRVNEDHPMHRFLVDAGIGDGEIDAFADQSGRPDQIGVNYYLTSERFLDDRCDLYPQLQPGGNGRDAYVDAEAIRVESLRSRCGLAARLREVWDRYALPMAVTEVHHGCTREQQLRWFAEAWQTAKQARLDGIELEAMTLWSLFGAMDWRSLITREDLAYDVGALDVRSVTPRPTAMAKAASAFAAGRDYANPVLGAPGWWDRPERLYPWSQTDRAASIVEGRPILITGGAGTLGQAFARIAAHRGLAHRVTTREELDICNPASIEAAVRDHEPWAIINAAGFVRVADADRETSACMAANTAGAGNLARLSSARGIQLLTFSSDLVFDGYMGRPYLESDLANPSGIYGQSKFMAERIVAASDASALVIRTSAFFGPWDRHNFAWLVLEHLRSGTPFGASTDVVSPTFVPDLCHAALDLLVDGEAGLWHIANQGSVSWHDFARTIAERSGFDPGLIFACERSGPPRNTALISMRGTLLRPFDAALTDYLKDVALEDVAATPPRIPAAPTDHSAAAIAS